MVSSQNEGQKSSSAKRSSESKESPEKAALVINVKSWATPIIGLIMLMIGLMAGYFGRPFFVNRSTNLPTDVAASQQSITSTTPPVSSSEGEALMDTLISQTRHFKGNSDAPITIIEFSDFQ
jgi:hypothetical protein